jgi:hypothetical protein
MTPISITTTSGRSPVAQVDNFQAPFNVGIHLVVTGTPTYNVELTPQDPMDATPTVWNAAPSLSGLTTSQAVSMTVPCRAISLNITGGSGSVTAYITQAGER